MLSTFRKRFGFFLFITLTAQFCTLSAQERSFLIDFRKGDHGWRGNVKTEGVHSDPQDGLVFRGINLDPWVYGPLPAELPTDEKIKVTFRLRSSGDRFGEVFYGGPKWHRLKSAQFKANPDGQWHEYEVMIPPLGEPGLLRLDVSHYPGEFAVEWVRVEAMPSPDKDMLLPAPRAVNVGDDAGRLNAGAVSVRHNGKEWNGFVVEVANEQMATGFVGETIGYSFEGKPYYIDLGAADVTVKNADNALVEETVVRDRQGGYWKLSRTFEPDAEGLGIEVSMQVETSEDREVFHLPWMTLLPGFGSFGDEKQQALLPGVDYLGKNEASSSDRSFGPGESDRRIVKTRKLTSPFMALSAKDRYIAIAWNRNDGLAAVFDSPDRTLESGAHLMALWMPEVGPKRFENEISGTLAFNLKARQPLSVTAWIFGGDGATMAEAMQEYALNRGLPEIPPVGSQQEVIDLLADGWLTSAARDGGLYKHAVLKDFFSPRAAAESVTRMLWLASQSEDEALAAELRQAAELALAQLPERSNYTESIGHINRPVAPLVLGKTENFVRERLASARNQLKEFNEEGIRIFRPQEGKPDFSRTYWEKHASGYNFVAIRAILEAAAFSGDEALVSQALDLLDQQDALYWQTVPRGAQTWEIPLHAPDILSAAYMVSSYVLGYQITGNPVYLEKANYWAWAGLPFIYLDSPVDGEIGPFAGISVLAATRWFAPNWIGQPVQWSALVYATALEELGAVDKTERAFWQHVAKGIAASAIQQTYTGDNQPQEGDQDISLRGLLADFTILEEQFIWGAAIIPATAQQGLPWLYGSLPWFATKRAGSADVMIFAPGRIGEPRSTPEGGFSVNVEGWPEKPYIVRLSRLPEKPEQITWQGVPVEFEWHNERRSANIQVEKSGELVVTFAGEGG